MATVVESAFIPPWGAPRCLHTYIQGPLHIPSDFLKSRRALSPFPSKPILKRIENSSISEQNSNFALSATEGFFRFFERGVPSTHVCMYIYVYVYVWDGRRKRREKEGITVYKDGYVKESRGSKERSSTRLRGTPRMGPIAG